MTRRKLRFSPEAAAAMDMLGDDTIKTLSTKSNPLRCPDCDVVRPRLHPNVDAPERIVCADCGRHIAGVHIADVIE